MLHCPNCGGKVDEDEAFCKRCGFDLAQLRRSLDSRDIIKSIVIQRVDGIKRRDAEAIQKLIDKENYSKFDDWPPFERQGLDGLKREAEALKVLKEYIYEISDLKIDLLGDAALASFIIRYHGWMRDLYFNVKSRVTIVLVKVGDEWKIIHEHWSRFPEEEKFARRPLLFLHNTRGL